MPTEEEPEVTVDAKQTPVTKAWEESRKKVRVVVGNSVKPSAYFPTPSSSFTVEDT